MSEERLAEIKKFVADLPTLRQQVDDRGLLDRCQTAMEDLLAENTALTTPGASADAPHA